MRKTFAAWTAPNCPEARRLSSSDGVLTVTLRPSDGGLFVERVVKHVRKGCVVQACVFADLPSFQRWCDTDAVRFDYPLVYMGMLRAAGEILGRDERVTVAG